MLPVLLLGLVHVRVNSFAPIIDPFGEPHFEFMRGTLRRIATVAAHSIKQE